MLRSKKNRSIVSILQDRELNNHCAPYFLSVSAVSQILRSKNNDSVYEDYWQISSPRSITYDSGYLYFSDYTKCCSIYGARGQTPPVFQFQKTNAKKRVSDVICYSAPVYRDFTDICKCTEGACTCLSPYLLTISEDNWLCQHRMTDAKLVRQYYVNRCGRNFRFKYCDWDMYGERFILTSILNPDLANTHKPDVLVNLAVFTAFPIEFLALLEIKRSVFGKNLTAANVSDQHLILGLGTFNVHIYSFEDFLKEGDLTPFRLGQRWAGGRVGQCPVGLPMNFSYDHAPPLLYRVQCHKQMIRFGGHPYHTITIMPKDTRISVVADLRVDGCLRTELGVRLETASMDEDMDSLIFHPHHSNRVLWKTDHSVRCYQLTTAEGNTGLRKLYSMDFSEKGVERRSTSSFGRSLKFRGDWASGSQQASVLCTDYDDDLDLFAVLGVFPSHPSTGWVHLYDSETGDLVRAVRLREEVCDENFYQLYVDSASIVVIERRSLARYTVYVYRI